MKYLEYVPHNFKIDLLKQATVFVFPSFYEGFGLPPLEAMSLGCPVIASKTASLPEVCGEAAVYINPQRSESIATALEKVLGSKAKREAMIKRGYEQVKKFSWERCARETLKVYEKVYQMAGKNKKK